MKQAVALCLRSQFYAQKLRNIVGSALVNYLPLNDATGTTALDPFTGRNWTYGSSNVTLGQPGIGDGWTATAFGGAANGQVVPTTATLNGLNAPGGFNSEAGTLGCWVNVSTANMANGTQYGFVEIGIDANNRYLLLKFSANAVAFFFNRQGVANTLTSSYTGGVWLSVIGTWSAAANQRAFFLNGVQVSSGIVAGTWSGASLTTLRTQIASVANANYLPGTLAHVFLANRALSAAEIAQIGRVG